MPTENRWKLLRTNSAWLYTAEFIPRLGALLIVPIWSARIVPTEYARWILCLTAIEFLVAFGNMGLPNFMVKVLYRYHDERADKYFGMALKATMAITLVFSFLMALFSPYLSRVLIDAAARSDLFVYLGLYLFVTQFNNQVITYIQSRVQYNASFILVLSRWSVTMSLFLYLLLVRHQGFYSWVWSALLSDTLVLPISLYFVRNVRWNYFNRHMFRFAFRFSIPSLATQTLGWGQGRIGRYVLSFSGLGTGVGLLGVAQNFSQNYGALVRPVKVVASQILGHALEEDAESPYFIEFFHGFAFAGLALAFLGGLFFRDVMKLLIAPSYWGARAALPALVFALYMEEIFSLYHSLMFRHFKVWFDFTRTLIAFPIVAVATFILVPHWGYVGAAGAQLLGAAVMWLYAQRYAMTITKHSFLFYEKIVLSVVAFGLAEMAYAMRFPFAWRVALALVWLAPYSLYYWRRRKELFPTLTAHLGSFSMTKEVTCHE